MSYPANIAACVDRVADLVEGWKASQDTELEIRLGNITSSCFTTGVTVETMDSAIAHVSTNTTDIVIDDWMQIHDFFYSVGTMRVRSRVCYDARNMKTVSENITKEKVKHVNFVCSDNSVDLRASLTKEIVVDAHKLPKIVNPDHVRLRQRKSVHIGKSRKDACFRIDFTMTWSGKTRDECERKQKTSLPTYEIECELVKREYCTTRSSKYVAASLLMKATEILLSDSTWSAV